MGVLNDKELLVVLLWSNPSRCLSQYKKDKDMLFQGE